MQKASSDEAKIRRALLAWFRRHARPLPWRKSRDSYAVWVSEVMLQQTQVATVTPYYNRFLETFPTLPDLARASLERVLELWSGLGYYRRARHLHEAAKEVVRKFSGVLPQDYQQMRTLPGIGDYTARAVLSIAFNQPLTLLEGNVARVLSRLDALHGNLHQARFRDAVGSRLERLLSRRSPGAFNQALMELGQTICLPRTPRCASCPVRGWCRAYQSGQAERYPQPPPRRAVEAHYLAVAIIRRGPRVGMVRGLDGGLLDDLWNFPSAFGSSRSEALAGLQEKLGKSRNACVHFQGSIAQIRHRITYRSIHVDAYPVEVLYSARREPLRWIAVSTLPQAAISHLARKIARQVFADGKS